MGKQTEFFKVTSICREDLIQACNLDLEDPKDQRRIQQIRNLSDRSMRKVAQQLGTDYVEYGDFWAGAGEWVKANLFDWDTTGKD